MSLQRACVACRLEEEFEARTGFKREIIDKDLLEDTIADLPPQVREEHVRGQEEVRRAWQALRLLEEAQRQAEARRKPWSSPLQPSAEWESYKSDPNERQSSDAQVWRSGGEAAMSIGGVKGALAAGDEIMGQLVRAASNMDVSVTDARRIYLVAFEESGSEEATAIQGALLAIEQRLEEVVHLASKVVEDSQTWAARN